MNDRGYWELRCELLKTSVCWTVDIDRQKSHSAISCIDTQSSLGDTAFHRMLASVNTTLGVAYEEGLFSRRK